MSQLARVLVIMLLGLTTVLLQGCQGHSNTPCAQRQDYAQGLATLQLEKNDTLYELQLRQGEVDKMIVAAHAPGVVGVSTQWQVRKDEPDEKITQLKIKAHDLDLQIAASTNSNR